MWFLLFAFSFFVALNLRGVGDATADRVRTPRGGDGLTSRTPRGGRGRQQGPKPPRTPRTLGKQAARNAYDRLRQNLHRILRGGKGGDDAVQKPNVSESSSDSDSDSDTSGEHVTRWEESLPFQPVRRRAVPALNLGDNVPPEFPGSKLKRVAAQISKKTASQALKSELKKDARDTQLDHFWQLYSALKGDDDDKYPGAPGSAYVRTGSKKNMLETSKRRPTFISDTAMRRRGSSVVYIKVKGRQ